MAEFPVRLSDYGNTATLCGWGSVTEDNICSNQLHCMDVEIQNWKTCYYNSSPKGYNYQKIYYCGYQGRESKLALVIILEIVYFNLDF